MTIHSTEYKTHLNSPEWATTRSQKLEEADYECQRCGDSGVPLEVHHLTYDRLGHEWLEDLLVVCHECHELEDEERAERTRDRQWSARVDGYARRRWGEDWGLSHEWYQAEDALMAWLDEAGESY